jgi:hypothetical protein
MAKYDVTYSCGHKGTVQLVGPTIQREYKLKWFSESGLCEDCYKAAKEKEREAELARRQEAAERAAALAEVQELPTLTGTEKQVAWANTIRQHYIETMNKRFESYTNDMSDPVVIEGKTILKYILDNATTAHEWIDNRDNLNRLARKYRDLYLTAPVPDPEVNEITAEAEATVIPEGNTTGCIAEITANGDVISAKYTVRDDTFCEIVRQLRYKWDAGAWKRTITDTCGTVADRIAELGNKLLNAGLAIRIYDTEIRRKAVEADYEPECDNWVLFRKTGEYAGRLMINWYAKNDKLYQAARKIKGAKWDNGVFVVPVEMYQLVEDFADMHGFKISDTARKAIEAYKASLQPAVVPAKPAESEQPDKLKEILESSREVIDDLKDSVI